MSQPTPILPETGEVNGFAKLPDSSVVFLLGTDYFIGAPVTPEARVAVTPDQMGMLRDWLLECGVSLKFYMVKDAGARAGYSDEDYKAVGATILNVEDVAKMEAPHVVHALKEPTDYEATIPGTYMRIGALHTGDFKPDCGWAKVLVESNFSAIFDGSAVGGFAYKHDSKVRPRFRVPLRSSMSVYAGWLAGEDVGECLESDETVIISGGGVVGTSSADVLLEKHADQIKRLLIIEKFPERCAQLKDMYKDYPQVEIQQGFDVKDEDIKDAKGLILTIFVQGSAATPKVTNIQQVSLMKEGGHIVDVAIDEGGGIGTRFDNDLDPETGKPRMVTIEEIRSEVEGIGRGLKYFADNHMPRRRPREASLEHGRTALMYLATMLYLSAKFGHSQEALKHIMDHDYIEAPKTICDALILDLKHGLAFSNLHHTVALYRHVIKRSDDIINFIEKSGGHAVFV